MRPVTLGKENQIKMYKKIKKKSMATSTMIYIVMMLMALVLLFYFNFEKVLQPAQGRTPKQICKASAYAHSITKIKGRDLFDNPIICPTEMIEIEKKDNKKAQHILAQAMYGCWDQFGEGKLELFKEPNVYCTVCSHITFEDEDLQLSDFSSFLATKEIPLTDLDYSEGKKLPTYHEYLTGYKTSGSEFLKVKELKKIPDQIIDTSKDNNYAVIFVHIKGLNKWEDFTSRAQAMPPGLGVITIGLGVVYASTFISGGWILTAVSTAVKVAGGVIANWGVAPTHLGYLFGGEDFQWASFVVLRPYDEFVVQEELGCTYMPTKVT